MRKLKYHEKKLLKKVKFPAAFRGSVLRENKILRKYLIQNRDEYTQFNKLSGLISSFVTRLRRLGENDAVRIDLTAALLEKCYNLGVIKSKKNLALVEQIPASVFAQRRLSVMMVTSKMAQTNKEAVTFIEQGHVRVGLNIIHDPAFIVTRAMEDQITWADKSSIKKKVEDFNDKIDDFDALGE
ncbi:MAG: putative U3 small nucleolar ribonucleoprotein IMP3 [Streblomastix strix]|uniref:U3 small nucleolar ribonucleoprotein protein IMP3 n=1 Tax=Streblomastix strix TaxID=222440 RepID=A0A5J4UZ43_9EUKA|nr:MAG: putative U3 small nucleolar ribonucleoprotein IMP3 [Streblomastix strix]